MAPSSLKKKQQTANDSSKRPHNDGRVEIQGFAELAGALCSDKRFQKYQTNIVNEDIVELIYHDHRCFIIQPQLWRQRTKLDQIIAQFDPTEFSVVICAQESDLIDLQLTTEDFDLHFLVVPAMLASIAVQLDGVFTHHAQHVEAYLKQQIAENTLENVKQVLEVSRELNKERNVNKLLSLILEKARQVTSADAGSIYVVEYNEHNEPHTIIFKVSQNQSVSLNLTEFKIPVNDQSIVGNTVINARSINIPDLYLLDPDPSKNPFQAKHDTSWDKRIGYECHSMLSLPIFDISHRVIGVIQLINRKLGSEPLLKSDDFQTRILPFDETSIDYAEIVAHQAGIALENAMLTEEKERMFEGFVNASVKAIEQRDPTTSGHSHRVAALTLAIAQHVSNATTYPFKDIYFNEKQLREIKYASLLHDFGKLGVREQVLLKAKKLYPWQLDVLLARFELIRSRYETEYLRELINFIQAPNLFPGSVSTESLEEAFKDQLKELDEYLDIILKANEPTVLEKDGFERLNDIARKMFTDTRQRQRPFLLDNELAALSVSRGSLTPDEFAEIQSHVVHTFEFLQQIPWGNDLKNIPEIAAKHHEKLDGSGYPAAIKAAEIPIQSRMMTIADIFDALTASDRPYKKAVPMERALDIIEMEVKAGKCDPDLFKLFVESRCYQMVL